MKEEENNLIHPPWIKRLVLEGAEETTHVVGCGLWNDQIDEMYGDDVMECSDGVSRSALNLHLTLNVDSLTPPDSSRLSLSSAG